MIEQEKINEIANRIATQFDPEKIILFGSCATDTQNEDSDVDLLVVKDTDLPSHKRAIDMQYSLKGIKLPVDILVYTKNEFEHERNEKFTFLHSALETSKILYERASYTTSSTRDVSGKYFSSAKHYLLFREKCFKTFW